MFAHLRSHLAFGHSVRAGKVKLESIDASVLHDAGELLPTLLAVLFHNRSDEYMVRIIFLDLPELFQPDLDRPIRNQLDILKTDHFIGLARAQFSVTRHDID